MTSLKLSSKYERFDSKCYRCRYKFIIWVYKCSNYLVLPLHHSIPEPSVPCQDPDGVLDLASKHNVPNYRRFVFVIHPEGKEKTMDSMDSKKINFEVTL
jgi:hypothetical protein